MGRRAGQFNMIEYGGSDVWGKVVAYHEGPRCH
jgi:hypothetical protein